MDSVSFNQIKAKDEQLKSPRLHRTPIVLIQKDTWTTRFQYNPPPPHIIMEGMISSSV